MLPTPSKFHYIFNLRDLSRIWEGMLKICGDECQNKKTMLGLWKHECTRVVADRYYHMFKLCIYNMCILLFIYCSVFFHLWGKGGRAILMENFITKWEFLYASNI